MINLTNKDQLISYLKSHGLWAKHGLGQNFLVDKEALDKIIEAAGLQPEDMVIEVGPGLGTLTQELIQHSRMVLSIEIDDRLADLLACQFSITNSQLSINNQCSNDKYTNWKIENSLKIAELKIDNSELKLLNADILKLNIPELVGDKPYKVIANIPYYITSKIIKLFLTLENKPERMVILVQKEVAERICAKPGDMSVLALSVQTYGEPEIVDIVPKESFFPAPEVDSAILRIKDIHSFDCHFDSTEPMEKSITKDLSTNARDDNICEKSFFRLIHIGFASKRKTLLNNLAAGLHIDKTKAIDIIKSSGLPENVRAQELSLDQWSKIAHVLGDKY